MPAKLYRYGTRLLDPLKRVRCDQADAADRNEGDHNPLAGSKFAASDR